MKSNVSKDYYSRLHDKIVKLEQELYDIKGDVLAPEATCLDECDNYVDQVGVRFLEVEKKLKALRQDIEFCIDTTPDEV